MPIYSVSCSRPFCQSLKLQVIFFLKINPLTSNTRLTPQQRSSWTLKLNLRLNSQFCRRFSSLHCLLRPPKKMPPKAETSAPRVEAEYAKSARAACKKCGNNIAKGSLRLGIISKAGGGFDMTRWHHLHCFKADITAAENINGFSLLKASDQEALRNLVAEFGNEPEKSITAAATLHDHEGSCQKGDMHEDDQGSRKKPKLSGHNDEDFWNLFSPLELNGRYKDAILPLKWKAFQTVIVLGEDDGLRASEKIAAFDFDGCLVKTSLKRVGADAWSLQYQSVPEKLQSYHNKGYKLVIFTNESNIDRWKNSRQKAIDSKVGRLEGFIKRVEVPIQIFIACGIEGTGDPFRKPKPGMWRLMERHFNAGIAVDMEQSFYVGDAAGRIDDHSDADIGFAKAIGLKFFVPEDIFTKSV
ncbi:polynucleotide 3'-phosphatase ZDP isoform X2 [Cryptomeria japonica]|uniref:polynucleotide 3'-phosphatase ZDP isoform X2 n=1 Tax=Cryptomeria japonica TaxID=3369 RepID=UPI0027DA9A50|nr:polynucleotide 3'-phosphatase ZDP isoform X2 [Cryptomeria japonica]